MSFEPRSIDLGWEVYSPNPGVDADQHIVPMNDIKEHELSESCACHPQEDFLNEDIAWMHRAFDGREAYNDGTRKLN